MSAYNDIRSVVTIVQFIGILAAVSPILSLLGKNVIASLIVAVVPFLAGVVTVMLCRTAEAFLDMADASLAAHLKRDAD